MRLLFTRHVRNLDWTSLSASSCFGSTKTARHRALPRKGVTQANLFPSLSFHHHITTSNVGKMRAVRTPSGRRKNPTKRPIKTSLDWPITHSVTIILCVVDPTKHHIQGRQLLPSSDKAILGKATRSFPESHCRTSETSEELIFLGCSKLTTRHHDLFC